MQLTQREFAVLEIYIEAKIFSVVADAFNTPDLAEIQAVEKMAEAAFKLAFITDNT